MVYYSSNVLASSFFWVIIVGCVLMFAYGEFGAMYYRTHHQGKDNAMKDPIYWLFTAIWIGVFVTYSLATILAHRRIAYRADVQDNKNAERDVQKLLCVFILVVLLTCTWITAVMLYKSDIIGLICVVILMIGIAYQAGLTAKWGCSGDSDTCYCYECSNNWYGENNDSDSDCCDEDYVYEFGNGKGAPWLLLPYFVWLGFGGIVLPIAQGRIWGKKDAELFFDSLA